MSNGALKKKTRITYPATQPKPVLRLHRYIAMSSERYSTTGVVTATAVTATDGAWCRMMEAQKITRSPAVARMADRTASVVKLTLPLNGPWRNFWQKQALSLKRAHYEAK